MGRSSAVRCVCNVSCKWLGREERNLLYAAVTRGKRLVVLVGQKKAVAIAVRNASGLRRWSKLDEWLVGGQARPEREASLSARSRQAAAAAGAMPSC